MKTILATTLILLLTATAFAGAGYYTVNPHTGQMEYREFQQQNNQSHNPAYFPPVWDNSKRKPDPANQPMRWKPEDDYRYQRHQRNQQPRQQRDSYWDNPWE